MNVGELRRSIAAYLNPDYAVNTTEHPAEPNPYAKFTVGDVDLLLLALNNVRTEAEQLRDFELSKCDVDVAVDGYLGGSLDEGVLHGTDVPVTIKSVIDGGWRQDSGLLVPVSVMSRDHFLQEQRRIMEQGWSDGPDERYRGDAPSSGPISSPLTVLLNGNDIGLNPSKTTSGTVYNIELSVYRWLGPYDNDDDSDFMTDFCQNYMLWAGIVECNHLVKQFVPRQEGNLPPPDKLKERAWAAVEKWDDFIQETGRISRM